jgi:hypothetical protein
MVRAAGGGPPVDGRRRGLRVEHRWRGAEAPGKVREVGHHRGSGVTVGWGKRPEATTFISGRAMRWSSVAGGSPYSILELRGR